MNRWQKHPAVRTGSDLTFGERAADVLRNSMGSWPFIGVSALFLATWMGFNGKHGFDPYPFILLNLVLSCLAAMQGAIILIAQKRADQIASELAEHDYEADCVTRDAVTQLATLTNVVHDLVVENTRLTAEIHALTTRNAPR
ncbi:MAG: DUF1003 domain-containing protein [Actinobacteria bacterium]|nr:DUF1003 domain-containing protein [Actinomycetota bacterium]